MCENCKINRRTNLNSDSRHSRSIFVRWRKDQGRVNLAQNCETPGLPGRWRGSLWWDLNEFGGKLQGSEAGETDWVTL